MAIARSIRPPIKSRLRQIVSQNPQSRPYRSRPYLAQLALNKSICIPANSTTRAAFPSNVCSAVDISPFGEPFVEMPSVGTVGLFFSRRPYSEHLKQLGIQHIELDGIETNVAWHRRANAMLEEWARTVRGGLLTAETLEAFRRDTFDTCGGRTHKSRETLDRLQIRLDAWLKLYNEN